MVHCYEGFAETYCLVKMKPEDNAFQKTLTT